MFFERVYAQVTSCGQNTQCCHEYQTQLRCLRQPSRSCTFDEDCRALGPCVETTVCDAVSYDGPCITDPFTFECYTECPNGFELVGPSNNCGGAAGGSSSCTPSAPEVCVDPDPVANPDSIRVTWYNYLHSGDPPSCNNCDEFGNPISGGPYCSIMRQVYVDSFDVTDAITAITAAGGVYCAEDSMLEFEGTLTFPSTGYWGLQYIVDRLGESSDGQPFYLQMDLGLGNGLETIFSTDIEHPVTNPIFYERDANDPDNGYTNIQRSGGCTKEGTGDFYHATEVCWSDCVSPGGLTFDIPSVFCDWQNNAGGMVYDQWFGETSTLIQAGSYRVKAVFNNAETGKIRWLPQDNTVCRFYPGPPTFPGFTRPACNMNSFCSNISNNCIGDEYNGYECDYTNNDCTLNCDVTPSNPSGHCIPAPAQCPDPITSDCANPNVSWQDIPPSALSPTGAADCACTTEPTCTVTVSPGPLDAGSPVSLSVTGDANTLDGTTGTVRVFAERYNPPSDIASMIDNGVILVDGFPAIHTQTEGRHFYNLGECTSDPAVNEGSCSIEFGGATGHTLTLPSHDSFMFHCDVNYEDATSRCTGNPFCNFPEDPSDLDIVDCVASGWQSCSTNDRASMCSDELTWDHDTCADSGFTQRTGTYLCGGPGEIDSCRGSISGTVYDASGTNGACDQGSVPPVGGVITANRSGGSETAAISAADGTYTFSNIPAAEAPTGTTYTFDTSSPDVFGITGYSILCPANPVTITGGQSQTNINFTIALISEAWFQIMGGNVRAGAGSQTLGDGDITQAVPATQAMLVRDEGDHEGSTGYPVIGESSNTVTAVPGLVSFGDSHDDAYGVATRRGPREGFTFFLQRYSMPAVPQSDFDENGGQIPLTLDMFDGSFENAERNAYYASGDNNAVTTVVINDPLAIPADRSIVVFVRGNLEINNQITVAPGGFLAFFVSGNINIDETVVTAVSPTLTPTADDAVVQGVFVADGQIVIQSVGDPTSDGQFIGAGNFVAWNGFSLNRSYRNMVNNDAPIELFFARPDIVLNTPDEFMRPMYDWYEISP